jgi:hypothetical protein
MYNLKKQHLKSSSIAVGAPTDGVRRTGKSGPGTPGIPRESFCPKNEIPNPITGLGTKQIYGPNQFEEEMIQLELDDGHGISEESGTMFSISEKERQNSKPIDPNRKGTKLYRALKMQEMHELRQGADKIKEINKHYSLGTLPPDFTFVDYTTEIMAQVKPSARFDKFNKKEFKLKPIETCRVLGLRINENGQQEEIVSKSFKEQKISTIEVKVDIDNSICTLNLPTHLHMWCKENCEECFNNNRIQKEQQWKSIVEKELGFSFKYLAEVLEEIYNDEHLNVIQKLNNQRIMEENGAIDQIKNFNIKLEELRHEIRKFIQCNVCKDQNELNLIQICELIVCKNCSSQDLCLRCGQPESMACGVYCHKLNLKHQYGEEQGLQIIQKHQKKIRFNYINSEKPLGFLTKTLWEDGVIPNYGKPSENPQWRSLGSGNFINLVLDYNREFKIIKNNQEYQVLEISQKNLKEFQNLYNQYLDEVEERQLIPHQVKGKLGIRQHILFANCNYVFGNTKVNPLTSNTKFRFLLRKHFGLNYDFNACLAVTYINGSGLSLHKDDEPIHLDEKVFALTLMGEGVVTIKYPWIKDKISVNPLKAYLLKDQSKIFHGVESRSQHRIVLTFRNFKI